MNQPFSIAGTVATFGLTANIVCNAHVIRILYNAVRRVIILPWYPRLDIIPDIDLGLLP